MYILFKIITTPFIFSLILWDVKLVWVSNNNQLSEVNFLLYRSLGVTGTIIKNVYRVNFDCMLILRSRLTPTHHLHSSNFTFLAQPVCFFHEHFSICNFVKAKSSLLVTVFARCHRGLSMNSKPWDGKKQQTVWAIRQLMKCWSQKIERICGRCGADWSLKIKTVEAACVENRPGFTLSH